MTGDPARQRGFAQRGFALLIVLWSLALIAFLATQLVAAGRQDVQAARNMMDAAVTEAAVDGAVQQAIFRLLDPSTRHWDAGDTLHAFRLGPTSVTVRIEPESDRVNPNIASAKLLRALLAQLGADRVAAATVADAIVRWRSSGGTPAWLRAEAARYRAAGSDYAPSGLPFHRANDLAAVLGMTPTLLARLVPHLTVFSAANPTAATHDPVVARALGEAATPADSGDDTGDDSDDDAGVTVSVIADARGPGDSRFIAHAVVRIDPAVTTRRYRILAFERQSSSPP